jgi:Flp pilus assembly pilin Flp
MKALRKLWIKMNNTVEEVLKNEKGQAITEYALIIGLIVLVVIVAIGGIGQKLLAIFTDLINAL